MDPNVLVIVLVGAIVVITLAATFLLQRFNPLIKLREKRMEQITLLLQKVEDTKELSEFLKSAEGKKLLELAETARPSLRVRLLRLFTPAFLFLCAGSWLSYKSVTLEEGYYSRTQPLAVQMAKLQFLGSWCIYAGLVLLIAMGIVYIVDRTRSTGSR